MQKKRLAPLSGKDSDFDKRLESRIDKQREEARTKGVKAFVKKPVDGDKLKSVLSGIFEE